MAERLLCALAIAGLSAWGGYWARDVEAKDAHLHCSAYLEDGRPLLESYIDTAGRVSCLYREPVIQRLPSVPRGKKT